MVPRNYFFSCSIKGKFPCYSTTNFESKNINHPVIEDVNGRNDCAAFDEFSDVINERLDGLVEFGLIRTKILLEHLFTADINMNSRFAASIISYFVALAGYITTDVGVDVHNTAKKSAERVEIKDNPVIDRISDYTRKMVNRVGLQTFKETADDPLKVFNSLNSNSAGIEASQKLKVGIRVQGPRSRTSLTETFINNFNKESTNNYEVISTGDKSSIYLSTPVDFINDIRLENGRTSYDKPGRMGFRFVTGGRGARGIYLVHISVYVVAVILCKTLYGVLHSKQYDSHKHDFPNAYPKPVGSLIADNIELLVASSVDNILCNCSDFDGFDGSFTIPMLEAFQNGMRKGMDDIGVTNIVALEASDGTQFTFGQLCDIMVKEGYSHGYYQTTYYPDPVQFMQMLTSGQYWTSLLGAIGNKVLFDYEQYIAQVADKDSEIVKLKIQGDDRIEYVYVKNDVLKQIQTLVELSNKSSEDCGFKISRAKTVCRIYAGDFLRVFVEHGIFIFNNQIVPTASEKIIANESPQNIITSYFSKIGTMCSRGLVDDDVGARFMIGVSMIKNNSLRLAYKDMPQVRYYFPCGASLVPTYMGGPGSNYYSVLAPQDMLCVINSKESENTFDINRYAILYYNLVSHSDEEMIEEAIMSSYSKYKRGDGLGMIMETKEGWVPKYPFEERQRDLEDAIPKSKIAKAMNSWQHIRGLIPRHFGVDMQIELMIRQIVTSSRRNNLRTRNSQLNTRMALRNVNSYLAGVTLEKHKKSIPWLNDVEVTFQELKERNLYGGVTSFLDRVPSLMMQSMNMEYIVERA
jgi:nitrogen fixation-related uncharacterized protein